MDKGREPPPETGGPGELKVRYSRRERYAMTRNSAAVSTEFTKRSRRIILFDLLFLFVIVAVIFPLIMRFSEVHTFQGYAVITKVRKKEDIFHITLKISPSGEEILLPSGSLYEVSVIDGEGVPAVSESDLLPGEKEKRTSQWNIDIKKNPPPYKFILQSGDETLEFSLTARKKRPRGALLKYLVDSW